MARSVARPLTVEQSAYARDRDQTRMTAAIALFAQRHILIAVVKSLNGSQRRKLDQHQSMGLIVTLEDGEGTTTYKVARAGGFQHRAYPAHVFHVFTNIVNLDIDDGVS